jgi:hypothetical protein
MDDWHSRNVAPDVDWERAVTEPGYLTGCSSLQHIPRELIELLEKSMLRHSTNLNLHQQMAEQFHPDNPFTYQDFLGAIHSKASGKSAGMSGFSINMLKLLDEECKRKLLRALNTIWSTRSASDVPDSWHHRFMCLIPKEKDAVVTLEKVRPISLFETMRKVWTSMIMYRVQHVWNHLNVLHTSQNAYRKGYGIEMELTQILNILEAKTSQDIFLTSYDIEKAFDSVSRSFVIAAWMRLGVPRDIARYLVLLDHGGKTVIKSDHGRSIIESFGIKHAVTGEDSTRTQVKAFIGRDGFGQGDTPSAYGWDAVFDIQLVCLSFVRDLRIRREPQAEGLQAGDNIPLTYITGHRKLHEVPALGFADDLNILSPNREHAQLSAEIVSAFNPIAGLKTNVKKVSLVVDLQLDLLLRYGTTSGNRAQSPAMFRYRPGS